MFNNSWSALNISIIITSPEWIVLTLNQASFVSQSVMKRAAASILLVTNAPPRVFVRTPFRHDSAAQLYNCSIAFGMVAFASGATHAACACFPYKSLCAPCGQAIRRLFFFLPPNSEGWSLNTFEAEESSHSSSEVGKSGLPSRIPEVYHKNSPRQSRKKYVTRTLLAGHESTCPYIVGARCIWPRGYMMLESDEKQVSVQL